MPVYRSLRPGMRGADVAQLQAALTRLGYATESDGVFGEATKSAVLAWYRSAGYEPVPSSPTGDLEVAAARKSLADAQAALALAEDDLAKARRGQPDSVLAQAQSSLNTAQRALDEANATAILNERDAQVELDAATSTAARLSDDPTAAAADLDRARSAVVHAQSALDSTRLSDADSIKSASEQVWVATLALRELEEADEVPRAVIIRDGALEARDSAQEALAALLESTGPTVAQGEVVFVPVLPARIQSAVTALGPVDSASIVGQGSASESGALVSIAVGQLKVSTTIRSDDLGLIRVGMPVAILDEKSSVSYQGSIEFLADTASTGADGLPGFAAVVVPTDPLPDELSGANLRLTITEAATSGDVLVVPLAALSSSANGNSHVSILNDADAVPVDVDVVAGMSADGYVAVEPKPLGSLRAGDRVVVGR